MANETRQTKMKRQIDELYRAYGEFAVQFEHLIDGTRMAIADILQHEGLHNQQVANIILADLTAAPLRNLFGSLVGETKNLDKNDRRIFDNVLKRMQALTERRNEIIHGTWYIGWTSEVDDDFSIASGVKLHKSNKGGAVKSFKHSVTDFENLSKEAVALSNVVLRIYSCFHAGRSLALNFKVATDGKVSVPDAKK